MGGFVRVGVGGKGMTKYGLMRCLAATERGSTVQSYSATEPTGVSQVYDVGE